jgi:predicted RNase H-like nuclease (RuvC/YqgF family)
MTKEFYDCIADWAEKCHKLSEENRALHSQVIGLNERLDKFKTYYVHENELNAAEARITALEATLEGYRHSSKIISQHLTDAQQRITQLEGALKRLWDTRELEYSNSGGIKYKLGFYGEPLDIDRLLVRSGVYREWCRDPKLCQDKGTCPKDPTCAD